MIHGLTRADTEELTLGEFLEIIIEYNDIMNPPKGKGTTENVRTATQADFDAF